MHYLRTGGRIPVELPVEIRWKAADGKTKRAQGKTVSISSNGVLLAVGVKPRPGTAVTITVNLPLEFTKVPLKLHCRGRVLRRAAGETVLSAVIDEYDLRPAEPRQRKASRRKK